MANIRPYYDKNGKLKSYQIRVYKGRDENGKQLPPYKSTFYVPEGWSEATAYKKAKAAAAVFEQECYSELHIDTNQTFSQYANYVVNLKKDTNIIKYSTYVRYIELLSRIIPIIGFIKLRDLRVQHLNKMYIQIKNEGVKKEVYSAKSKLNKIISEKNFGEGASDLLLSTLTSNKRISKTLLGRAAGVSQSTVGLALEGNNVKRETAEAIASAVGYSLIDLFDKETLAEQISDKTVLEHHRLVSSILAEAVKEGMISTNIAEKASPPKPQKKEAEYYEPETVKKVLEVIEKEPIYWQVIALLIIYTGARRGEILGLRTCDVDITNMRIHIVNNLQYKPDMGIYIDTPKNGESRWVAIPQKVKDKIEEYINWKQKFGIVASEKWKEENLLFMTINGDPIHPDSVTDWFSNLEKKYQLPHLHPHAFRHSIASALIFNDVDIVSVASQLGHANASTTEKIYAHVLKAAEKKNAEVISAVYG